MSPTRRSPATSAGRPDTARPPAGVRRAGPLLAIALLLAAPVATAGMLSITDAVADFTFEDGRVDYQPTLADSDLRIDADNAVRLAGVSSYGVERPPDGPVGFGGKLRLRADVRGGDLLEGDFNVFGSLTPASKEATATLIGGTLDAMQVTSDGDAFSFLLGSKRATGALAQQYRNIGIFATVAGIAEEDWVRDFDSGASLMNLIRTGDPRAGPNANPANRPVPAPATPLLLVSGTLLFLVLRRKERRKERRHGRRTTR